MMQNRRSNKGFTLIEIIVTIMIVGILSAIAVPSWLSFIQTRRLNTAQDQVYRSLREAQSNARKEKRTWAACFHDNGTKIDWSVSQVTEGTWSCTNATNWQTLSSDSNVITIDSTNTNFTASPTTYYPVKFKYDGSVTPLGKITLGLRDQTNGAKRCVIVSTLLGAIRTDKDNGCR